HGSSGGAARGVEPRLWRMWTQALHAARDAAPGQRQAPAVVALAAVAAGGARGEGRRAAAPQSSGPDRRAGHAGARQRVRSGSPRARPRDLVSGRRGSARAGGDVSSVKVAVLTASDTRTPETDVSGRVVREALADAGFEVIGARVVP